MTTTPTIPFDLATSATAARDVALAVSDDQFDDPTPCADWTVRDLLTHVCGLAIAFRYTATKESIPGGEPRLADDWREQLPRDLDALVTAWRDPQAWQGESEAGGVRMPAAALAAVAVDELVLHGWDLARAVGQPYEPADGDVAIATGFAASMSTPETVGMRGGLYGPLLDVPESAAPFERLLCLAGRDPAWQPS